MGRKILAVIVAWIVAAAIMLIGADGNGIHLACTVADHSRGSGGHASLYRRAANQAFVVLTIIYVVASFAAGFIVTKMARRVSPGMTLPLIIGNFAVYRRDPKFLRDCAVSSRAGSRP